jgi:hypothetical protein
VSNTSRHRVWLSSTSAEVSIVAGTFFFSPFAFLFLTGVRLSQARKAKVLWVASGVLAVVEYERKK